MIEEKTGKLAEADVLETVLRLPLWMIVFSLFFLALYCYLSQVLFSFPATRGFAAIPPHVFTEPVLKLGSSLVEEIPSFIVLGFIFFLTRYLLKIVKLLFQNIELGMIELSRFELDWTWPNFQIVRAVMVICSIVIAYPYMAATPSRA